MKRLLLIAALALAGCAGTPISEFTHADLQNAQKIAVTPARAAVWKAVEDQVTAIEKANAAILAQAKACEDALKALGTTKLDSNVGIATLIEMKAGAATTDALAKVKADCVPIHIPATGLPKL